MAYFNIENFLSKVTDPDGLQRTTQFRCRIPVFLIGMVGDAAKNLGAGRTQAIRNERAEVWSKSLGARLTKKYSKASTLLQHGLLCEQTRTPSRSFQNETLGIYGLEEKYPVFTTYTDHECTFMTPLIERGGKHHNDVANIFHEWQNGVQERTDIFGDDASMVTNFPDDYRLTEGMQLDQFSTYNPKRRGAFLGVNVNAQGNVRDVIQDVNRVTRIFNGPQIPTSWTTRQNSDDKDSEPSISYKFFNVFPQTVESSPVAWMGDADYQRVTVSFTYSYWSLAADSTLANQS